jgi:hypothetical protein
MSKVYLVWGGNYPEDGIAGIFSTHAGALVCATAVAEGVKAMYRESFGDRAPAVDAPDKFISEFDLDQAD